MDEEDWEDGYVKEFVRLFKQSKRIWNPTKKELKLVNRHRVELRKLKIEIFMQKNKRNSLIALLNDYANMFAWSYVYMPDLDIKIIVYKLSLIDKCKSIKQNIRRMGYDILVKVKNEEQKQQDARFFF